jgi:hypothetical protein
VGNEAMRLLRLKYRDVFFNAMAVLFLFCCSITNAVRRWLKTQAAAEMVAANEAMYLRRRKAAAKTVATNEAVHLRRRKKTSLLAVRAFYSLLFAFKNVASQIKSISFSF